MENGLIKMMCIEAYEDHMRAALDRAQKNGRMPAANVQTANNRLTSVTDWLFAQPGEYFPTAWGKGTADEFISRATKDFIVFEKSAS